VPTLLWALGFLIVVSTRGILSDPSFDKFKRKAVGDSGNIDANEG
jgi:hypothetical protein